MNTLTLDELNKFLTTEMTYSSLDCFIRKHSVYDQYKKTLGDKYKAIIENKWELANTRFRKNENISDLIAEDYLAIIELDMVLSPYTGVPYEKRKEFYIWCLEKIKNHYASNH